MSYDVKIEDRQPMTVASVRKEIAQDQIGVWVEEAVGRLFPALGAAGVSPAGPMVCRYHTWEDGRTECEVALPVSGEVPDTLDESELPGGRSATVLHVGHYDDLSNAYDALSSWIESAGEAPAAGPFEIYLNDPSVTPPEEWQTQVVWPLG